MGPFSEDEIEVDIELKCKYLPSLSDLQADTKESIISTAQAVLYKCGYRASKKLTPSFIRTISHGSLVGQTWEIFEQIKVFVTTVSKSKCSIDEVNALFSSVHHNKTKPSIWNVDESAFFTSGKPTAMYKPSNSSKRSTKYRDNISEDDELLSSEEEELDQQNGIKVRTFVPWDSIECFDGNEDSPDRANNWLTRFKHVARSASWTEKERLKNFKMYMTRSARQWYIQLPPKYTKQWMSLEKKFKKTFCIDQTSMLQQYYDATRSSRESPKQYLWRLNALAIKAGIPMDNGNPAKQHIKQFLKTVRDDELCSQILPLRLKDTDDLMEVIEEINFQDHDFRSKRSHKRRDSFDSRDGNPRHVHFTEGYNSCASDDELEEQPKSILITSGSKPTSEKKSDNPKKKCSICNKNGHEDNYCWTLVTCRYCNQQGHPKERCFLYCNYCERIHKNETCPQKLFMEALTKAVRNGLELPTELKEHLNLEARQ
jgi:hypothetical protein